MTLFQSRHFNKLILNDDLTSVTKSSSIAPEIINDEIYWYKNCPESILQSWVPKIEKLVEDPANPKIQMEYVLGTTVYDEVKRSTENHIIIIDKIIRCLKDMNNAVNYDIKEHEKAEIHANFLNVYKTKTLDRIFQYIDDPEFAQYKTFSRIGYAMPFYIEDAVDVINRLTVEDILGRHYISERLGVIHGDFHLGNMLFVPETKSLKVIDPRGSFGVRSVFGDKMYDVAKLFLSIKHDYNVIESGDFIIPENNTRVIVCRNENWNKFKELILSHPYFIGINLDLICALLFLSMVPMHNNKRAQRAFVIKGLGLLSDVVFSRISRTNV